MKLTKSVFALLFPLALSGQSPAAIDLRGAQSVIEFTGQVANTGMASIQAGYLNYVRGWIRLTIAQLLAHQARSR